MVEMTHRFMPPVVEARELIADGLIGNVLAVDDLLLENVGLFGSLPSWMFQQAQAGGGVGLTSGVHLLDHVSWLTGQRLSLESACFGYSQGMGECGGYGSLFLAPREWLSRSYCPVLASGWSWNGRRTANFRREGHA